MSTIDLKFGRMSVPIVYDERVQILDAGLSRIPLTDLQIAAELDSPIETAPLEEVVSPGESVLLCVPDATRRAAAGQMVNLLVRRLIAAGTAPNQMSIIFSTGIHRKTTAEEKTAIVTPFIAHRIRMLDHDPRDLMQIVRLGHTSHGIPIELNRAVIEHDHTVLVGGISFHYFAGFTGGRKLVCPGLASVRTVTETHKLAFDCEAMSRRDGVAPGRLAGNPVHEAFAEVVAQIEPRAAISSVVDEHGQATAIHYGHWKESHEAGCSEYAASHTIPITQKRDVVVVSCGGWPDDINMIQAHKALDAAAQACTPGGMIIVIAECSEGLGRPDFLTWFDNADSSELAASLCRKYQVNGQTAWSLLKKAEQFDVRMVTDLDGETCARMRLKKIERAEIGQIVASASSAYILPRGAKVLVASKSSE